MTDDTQQPGKKPAEQKPPNNRPGHPQTKDREQVRQQYTNRHASRKEPSQKAE